MKNFTTLKFLCSLFVVLWVGQVSVSAQVIDTLAFQDFEVNPASPTWTYTGTPNDFQSGNSPVNATPSNSPLGIGSSRAWHLRQVSGGNPVTFINQTIPSGYDTIRVQFRLAGMNLNGTSGGPDNLDYVLVAYSTNGGTTFSNRLRVRGAINNNCSWPYSAATTASLWYLPATEVVFQPTNSGLQLQAGVSTVELTFPGSITQLSLRITPRSSSSSDSWLIDNLVLQGERSCTNSTSSISVNECEDYTSPSGNVYTSSGTYLDTIPNAAGCDSLITINLAIANNSTATISPTVCGSYTSPSGMVWTSSNTYPDTISNAAGCDSILIINLTVNNSTSSTLTETACDSYTSPSGNVYTVSNTYTDTIPNAAGCDSILTINLTINTVDTSVTVSNNTLTATASSATYQWIDCDNGNNPISGETNQSFSPSVSGNYAVIVTENGCSDTSSCRNVTIVSTSDPVLASGVKAWPNPVKDVLHLDLGGLYRSGSVAIYTISGQRLQSWNFQNSTKLELPSDDLAPGIYFVDVKADGQRTRIKMVKK